MGGPGATKRTNPIQAADYEGSRKEHLSHARYGAGGYTFRGWGKRDEMLDRRYSRKKREQQPHKPLERVASIARISSGSADEELGIFRT